MTGNHRPAAVLEGRTYTELFLTLDDTAAREAAEAAGGPTALRSVALDAKEEIAVRFLASELVFALDGADWPAGADQAAVLGGVYAEALARQLTDMANPWAFAGAVGSPAGEHAVALGPPAVPALRAALDDSTPVEFGGSREATVAEARRYRVKDLAAAIVAAIVGADIALNGDPDQRDAEIRALLARLHMAS